MQTQKKSWKKPLLIVIGRGTPEERVLKACKNSNVGWGSMRDGCVNS